MLPPFSNSNPKEEKPVQKKNRGMIIAFVTPALLFFVATFVYPIIRTIMMSFFRMYLWRRGWISPIPRM